MKKIYFIIFISHLFVSDPLLASKQTLLDLEGDGNLTPVILPFSYYQKQADDSLTLIHQGGYKVYNVQADQKEVAVIGPLRPCIGIAVTDGASLIVFHKHSMNSLLSMKAIMEENLDLANSKNVFARIYTTRDDVEWDANNRQKMHGGLSHREEVIKVKGFLHNVMGVSRPHIAAGILNLRKPNGQNRYEEFALGRYDVAELCIAIRVNDLFEEANNRVFIKLTSIDPFTEDIFGYNGTYITEAEYVGQNLAYLQKEYPDTDFTKKFMPYDQIPQLYEEQTGEKDGYTMQRGICQRRLAREEKNFYLMYFGQTFQQLIHGSNAYNSLAFYPIP